MIKLSVMYPKTEQTRFDLDYYLGTHFPMVSARLGDACKRVAVEEGVCGATPENPSPYVVTGHVYFDSLEDFQTAFPPHAEEIMGDIPNFTNVEPVVMISSVHL